MVRDASSGVLPGVTVETTSPALIERTRVTVTDDKGDSRFPRLPAGTYTVKFSLLGFTTVECGTIVITWRFTATIYAELAVGGVAETLTVTGELPLVDVRRTTTQLFYWRDGLPSKLPPQAGAVAPFAVVAFILAGVAWIWIPETKGNTLESSVRRRGEPRVLRDREREVRSLP